jgi:serine phosphatase RsbU (regulator of sigma subunit)
VLVGLSDRESASVEAVSTVGEQCDIASRAGELLQEVLRRTHLSSAPDLATVVAEEARRIAADSLVPYVVDQEQKRLIPVPHPGSPDGEPLQIQGTVAGRAFASTSIIQLQDDGGSRRLWLPLIDGAERLGVVEMSFGGRQEPLPEALVALCERLSHLIATLITNKDLYSDFFKLLRRRQSMTMASELIWDLVPPQVLATDAFVLGALLEPAYDNGGDAYDYAVNAEGILHFAVFDAMGHGLAAAGVAAFALAAYRHSRRHGETPATRYKTIDAAIFEQYPTSRFVTGLIAELELATGRLSWISAGHPPPLLLRSGHLIKPLDITPSPPLGMRLATREPIEGEEWLEPGDMLLLYTDGLTEARRPDGELFTVERLGEFIERQAANGLPAPETLRGLREAIIERGEGALRDDATALLLEWHKSTAHSLLPQTV